MDTTTLQTMTARWTLGQIDRNGDVPVTADGYRITSVHTRTIREGWNTCGNCGRLFRPDTTCPHRDTPWSGDQPRGEYARLIAEAPDMRDLLSLVVRTMGDCERHGLTGPLSSGEALLSIAPDIRTLLARIDGTEV